MGSKQVAQREGEADDPLLELGELADKVQIVVEVEDITRVRELIKVEEPPIQDASWGARLFQVRDPDGVPVTFLQWTGTEDTGP
jgi:hypothetical protein